MSLDPAQQPSKSEATTPFGEPVYEPFPTTHWSLVGRAAGTAEAAEQARQTALDTLLRRYIGAFRSYLLAKRRTPPDRVDDVVQGFISSKILERNLLGQARQERGKFRNFLMTALERYAIDFARSQNAQRRSSGGTDLSDQADRIASPEAEPARAFDRSWAREVVAEAVRRTQRACASSGRSDLWGVFEAKLLGPIFDGAPAPSYDHLMEQLAFESPAQAANALTSAKRIFARMLRSVIAEYALEAADVDEEVRDLQTILASG